MTRDVGDVQVNGKAGPSIYQFIFVSYTQKAVIKFSWIPMIELKVSYKTDVPCLGFTSLCGRIPITRQYNTEPTG